MLKAFLFLLYGYYCLELLLCWANLLAARWAKPRRLPPTAPNESTPMPHLLVVAPCRNAAGCIPGLVECLRKQTYPSELYRILIVADNCSDNTAETARSLGVEVYERRDSLIKTKGAALNELLERRLRQEPFDAMTILDIDSRVDPSFLGRVAVSLQHGSNVMQAILISKNREENDLTRIGDAAQALTQIHQRGRMVLGLPAYLQGSGLTISRAALERLEWHLGTGAHLTDDVEINIRCLLKDITIQYAVDQRVVIDLANDIHGLRNQKRRWSASVIELAAHYFWPMLRKGIRGDWRTLEALFSVFLSPPLSVSFLMSSLLSLLLMALALTFPAVVPWAWGMLFLAALHAFYYVIALKTARVPLSWKNRYGLWAFLWIRIVTVCQAPYLAFFARGDRWTPMPHGKESESTGRT